MSTPTSRRVRVLRDDIVWNWEAGQPGALAGSRCTSCGRYEFTPKPVCPYCSSEAVERAPLPTHGRVVTSTVIRQAPTEWNPPYALGYVELAENLRIMGRIEGDPEAVRNQSEVEVTWGTIRTDPDGTEVVSFRFRLAPGADNVAFDLAPSEGMS